MTENDNFRDDASDSISGRSAALFVAEDPSVARLLSDHGIRVRDFILVSFLSDQGTLSIEQLARILCIRPDEVQNSIKRLTAAGLVVHETAPLRSDRVTKVGLTGRGRDIAASVDR